MTKFKGFKSVSELEYSQRVFSCEKCGNLCEVTEIKTPSGVLYHGDVCERYSGVHKTAQETPDLFQERENLLMSYQKPAANSARVGIARTGMFSELAPFWFSLFSELGLDVILSRKTDKSIVRSGVEKATADAICFPFKVAFGHYQDLREKLGAREIDYIFVPDIMEAYPSRCEDPLVRTSEWRRSQACPYIQNFNALIVPDENLEVLHARVSFREGDLAKALARPLKRFGSLRKVRHAVSVAEGKYCDFKARIAEMGRKVLRERGKFVVLVGRPYATYDSAMNLRVVKKIQDLGFRALPQDFLPLPGEDLSGNWPNEMSIQGQLILNAANVIRKDPRLEAVFLDYFSCGPNSFIKTFFQEEMKGKPYLTLQIDEHSADAGLVTRLEAFLDSVK